ncbi:MAG: hypothetical protein GY862_32680 [Gammaproteobacteria bacterium]|nr:hypothetical protein [Gammaproteobacteria bacterium]
MNKANEEDMRPEYDFSQGVRGKHYRAMQQGYTITIQRSDGTKQTKEIQAPSGAVILEADVQ